MIGNRPLSAVFGGRGLHGLGLAAATGLAILAVGPMVYLAIMSPMVFRAAAGWHAALVAASIWLFTAALLACPIWAWIGFFRGPRARAWRPMVICAGCGLLFLGLWSSVDARGAPSHAKPAGVADPPEGGRD